MAVTVAPTTTAPVASFTVPVMAPVAAVCAPADSAPVARISKIASTSANALTVASSFMSHLPCSQVREKRQESAPIYTNKVVQSMAYLQKTCSLYPYRSTFGHPINRHHCAAVPSLSIWLNSFCNVRLDLHIVLT